MLENEMKKGLCLWVSDEEKKTSHGKSSGVDPETLRCKKDGKVWCRPCAERFTKGE